MANELLTDGTVDFSGGQNAAFDPTRIPANCYASGINISSDRSVIRPRWALQSLGLDFSETGNYIRKNKTTISFENIYKSGRFQAIFPYNIGTVYYTGIVISGVVFLVEKVTRKVTVVNPDDLLQITHRRVNWSDAGNYFTLYDYPNRPLILDGIESRRSDPAKNEVPVSVLGTYNQNRLFIGNAGNEFTGGDPSGSQATPDAPITFNEVIQSSSPFVGDVYQLPTSIKTSTITAMGFLQVIDTSTGIGPLLISTSNSISSFPTQQPRDDWKAGQFGSVVLFNAGIAGQRAFSNVMSDIIFMSPDKQIRTLSMSRNAQARWGNAPISREVQNFLKEGSDDLIKYTATGFFNNKFFSTANPYRVSSYDVEGNIVNDVAFGGFVVLEMDTTASIISPATTPVWAGLWTGIRPMDLCTVNEACYVMAKSDSGVNELYQMRPDRTYDEIDGKIRYIKSRLYTRNYTWKNEFATKQLTNLSLYMQNISEELTITAAYKPSHASTFQHWRTISTNAPVAQCKLPIRPQGFAPQSIRELNFGSVDDTACNPSSKDLYSIVKKTQVRLDITGKSWELTGIEIRARDFPVSDDLDVVCDEQLTEGILNECNDDWSIDNGNNECNNGRGKV